MSEVTDTWVQKRTSILKSANSVDKELARLKNIGAVSSVWTNKFVQNDGNSGGRRQSYIRKKEEEINYQSLLEKAQQELTSYKNQLKQLEETNQQEKAALWFQCETLKTQFAQAEAKLKKALETEKLAHAESMELAEYYKQQLEEQQDTASQRVDGIKEASKDEADSLWFQCETLKAQYAQTEARLKSAYSEIADYKQQLKEALESKMSKETTKGDTATHDETLRTQLAHTEARLEEANLQIKDYKQQLETLKSSDNHLDMVAKDEAAALWFQCETFKTQLAQTEARLKKANARIEEHEQQLTAQQKQTQELQDDLARKKTELEKARADIESRKDKEAALWFEGETLKTKLAQTEARFRKEMERCKSELEEQKLVKAQLEEKSKDEAATLWFQYEALKTQSAQLEARLKKEINAYKQRYQDSMQDHTANIRQFADLIMKQDELLEHYETSLSLLSHEEVALMREELTLLKKENQDMEQMIASLTAGLEMGHQQMNLALRVSTELQNDFSIHKERRDRVYQQEESTKYSNDHIQQLKEALAAKDRVSQEVAEANNHLNNQIAQLKEALAARDRVIEGIETELENQRTSADKQIVSLTQTILDKDARIMDMMNRNKAGSGSSTPTESYFSSTGTPRLQMSKVREFMYSTTSDDDSDVLVLSDDEPRKCDYFSHYDDDFADAVSSPVSSRISFETTEEETDLKHFSFASAKSRPISGDVPPMRQELLKEWPIPPPTPPPSDPLPPIPKRGRSRTMGQHDVPNTSIYTTSVHQTNELPKIIPIEKQNSTMMD